jgi:hypothetical protein
VSTDGRKPADIYRVVLVSMWSDQRFARLPPEAMLLLLYLRTGPASQPITGVALCGPMATAEALNWNAARFRRAFAALERAELARADWGARLVWLPDAIRERAPDNPNIVRGWRAYAGLIPDCPLRVEIRREILAVLKGRGGEFVSAFVKAFPERCREPSPEPFTEGSPERWGEQEEDEDREGDGERDREGDGEREREIAPPPPARADADVSRAVEVSELLFATHVERWQRRYGKSYAHNSDRRAKKNCVDLLLRLAPSEVDDIEWRAKSLVEKFFEAPLDRGAIEKRHPFSFLVEVLNGLRVDRRDPWKGDAVEAAG